MSEWSPSQHELDRRRKDIVHTGAKIERAALPVTISVGVLAVGIGVASALIAHRVQESRARRRRERLRMVTRLWRHPDLRHQALRSLEGFDVERE